MDRTLVAAHIPRGAVWALAATFSECARRVVHEGTWESLHELWLFAKVVFAAPGIAGKGHWANFGKQVTGRAQQFHRPDVGEMWGETRSKAAREGGLAAWRRRGKDEEIQRKEFVERIVKIVGTGPLSKAFWMLASDGLQDPENADVWERLRSLHPAEEEVGGFGTLQASVFEFAAGEESERERLLPLRRLVASSPMDFSGGPPGRARTI